MKSYYLKILGLTLFIFLGIILNANCPRVSEKSKPIPQKNIQEKITAQVEKYMEAFNLPGLAVGVVKDNEVIYARGFGYENVETQKPVTTKSVFHMASVSKPFVATAIMQLVEQGKMDLEAPVIKYLPYFKLAGGDYQKITIRQMLNHTSGTPDVLDYEWDNPVYDEEALERYVKSITSEEMIFKPGEKHRYSNMAFDCLGDVIGKVSGLSFADYVKKNILNPTGMQESTFLMPASGELPDNWVSPHIHIVSSQAWDGYPYNRMHGPSSTLHSNVEDMCKWALINLNKGAYKNQKILKAASYDLLWKPWFKVGKTTQVGLSWFLRDYKDEKLVGHSGGDTGFGTYFMMVPEKSIGIVVLCNQSPAPVGDINRAILDIMLGHEPESVPKLASIPVLKALENEGMEAAVKVWEDLKEKSPDEYVFSFPQFGGLYVAAEMDKVDEAVLMAKLIVRIFGDEVINNIKKDAEYFINTVPDNKAAPAVLKVMNEKK